MHCVFVDNGLLRKDEAKEIESEFSEMNLSIIDAKDRFLDELQGIDDPEQKRKIIGRVFIEVFTDFRMNIPKILPLDF